MTVLLLEDLIDKQDTFEVVRDQIGAILLAERDNQKTKAVAEDQDPGLWDLRIFTDRDQPWSEWIESPDQVTKPEGNRTTDSRPIINIAWDNSNFDASASSRYERQKTNGVYHIDCFGYGKARNVHGGGHEPGDREARRETQRAVRLVRNILMAAQNTYLQMQGVVWGRWIDAIQAHQPEIDGRHVQQIFAARIAFRVEFNELSPQVEGQPIEIIGLQVERGDTGEIYFNAEYQSS